MTGHNVLKSPSINPLHRLIEFRSIPPTHRIPKQPLLPNRIAPRILQRPKNPRRPPGGGILPSPRILFFSWKVEQQIRLNQRLARLVEEHQLFIRVCFHELVFELLVELAADFDAGLVFCGEDCGDRDVGYGFVGFGLAGALFGQPFGCDYVRGGEGG